MEKFDSILKKILPKPLFPFYSKYREQLTYLFFGGMTTVVNWAVSLLVKNFMSTAAMTAVAWFAAVLFAYFTNRAFVFSERRDNVMVEMLGFFGARLMSLGLDELIMVTFVDVLGFNVWIVKFFSQIAVVVFNYFASKLFIFKKKRG